MKISQQGEFLEKIIDEFISNGIAIYNRECYSYYKETNFFSKLDKFDELKNYDEMLELGETAVDYGFIAVSSLISLGSGIHDSRKIQPKIQEFFS